jgi:hypothetical protein
MRRTASACRSPMRIGGRRGHVEIGVSETASARDLPGARLVRHGVIRPLRGPRALALIREAPERQHHLVGWRIVVEWESTDR